MTKEEAVTIAIKAKEKWGGGSSEWWLVNALESLGLIEFDEPPKQDELLARALVLAFSFDASTSEMALFRKHLAVCGLVVVPAPVSEGKQP